MINVQPANSTKRVLARNPVFIASFSFLKNLVTRNALTYVGHDINMWTDGTPNGFTAWKTQLAPRLTYKRGSSNLKQPAFVCKKKCKFLLNILQFHASVINVLD